MQKCRFKSQFEFVYYDETNRVQIEQILRTKGFSIVKIEGKDELLYCSLDKHTKQFTSDINPIFPNNYVIFYDTGTVSTMSKEDFEATFDIIEEE